MGCLGALIQGLLFLQVLVFYGPGWCSTHITPCVTHAGKTFPFAAVKYSVQPCDYSDRTVRQSIRTASEALFGTTGRLPHVGCLSF